MTGVDRHAQTHDGQFDESFISVLNRNLHETRHLHFPPFPRRRLAAHGSARPADGARVDGLDGWGGSVWETVGGINMDDRCPVDGFMCFPRQELCAVT